jgi:ribokinase
MTHIVVLGSTNMDLVAYVDKAPAPEVTAVDSTGAGDTFVGALAVALAEERPIREALKWAAAAAALSVQRPGASASMPYRSEIETEYAS